MYISLLVFPVLERKIQDRAVQNPASQTVPGMSNRKAEGAGWGRVAGLAVLLKLPLNS